MRSICNNLSSSLNLLTTTLICLEKLVSGIPKINSVWHISAVLALKKVLIKSLIKYTIDTGMSYPDVIPTIAIAMLGISSRSSDISMA